jgi:hypothetical protein
MFPGTAILLNGVAQSANREISVPGRYERDYLFPASGFCFNCSVQFSTTLISPGA